MISIHKCILLSITYVLLAGCDAKLEVTPDTPQPTEPAAEQTRAEAPEIKLDATQRSQPEAKSPLHPLAWMMGCWQTRDRATIEVWSPGLKTHMFGHSFTRREGKVVFFEQMRIVRDGETYVFSAYPMGKGPSDFAGATDGPLSLVFENPGHDYPQRIVYKRVGNTLTGTVSLADGSEPNSWVYTGCTQ